MIAVTLPWAEHLTCASLVQLLPSSPPAHNSGMLPSLSPALLLILCPQTT